MFIINYLYNCKFLPTLTCYPGRNVCTKRLFGHVITCHGICSAATSSTYLPVVTDTALAFKAAAVSHSRKVIVIVPYICKFLFEDIATFYRQITTGKYVSLMSYEEHPKACKASPRNVLMSMSSRNSATDSVRPAT